jgi:6,7-dimethyl-8-ribityllumazine synthase
VKSPSRIRKSARGLKVALVCSSFNAPIVRGLEDGARRALLGMGAREKDLETVSVPGAFELPLAAKALALSGRFHALVALGAVIQGETDHYEHIARAASSGLQEVGLETGIPVGFGVLTVREEAQARVRSGKGPDNKGAEAARAAVAMALVLKRFPPRT